MASTVTELMMRRMGAKSSSIDWEAIARGMVDGTTEFDLTDFPASSTSNYRFYQRVGLKSVVMDNTITSIGERCFGGCTNLESIVISSNLTSVGFGAFDGCNALKNITIPSSVTSIGNYAFNNCTGLTSITIPNSVTTIGNSAFRDCTGLTMVTIGNSVTTINYAAFYGCTGLTSVTIPNSVTTIGNYAFSNCRVLEYMIFEPTTPPTLADTTVFNNTNNCPIYVPDASVNDYKAANVWSNFASRISPISDLTT